MDTCTVTVKILLANTEQMKHNIEVLRFVLQTKENIASVLLAKILFSGIHSRNLATICGNVITIWGQEIWIREATEKVGEVGPDKYVLRIGGIIETQGNLDYFEISDLYSPTSLNAKKFTIEADGVSVNAYNFLRHVFQSVHFPN